MIVPINGGAPAKSFDVPPTHNFDGSIRWNISAVSRGRPRFQRLFLDNRESILRGVNGINFDPNFRVRGSNYINCEIVVVIEFPTTAWCAKLHFALRHVSAGTLENEYAAQFFDKRFVGFDN